MPSGLAGRDLLPAAFLPKKTAAPNSSFVFRPT